ncbi:MAG: hypothetical protein WDN47_02845 [Candidatus Doudnabacteria bacterium]
MITIVVVRLPRFTSSRIYRRMTIWLDRIYLWFEDFLPEDQK